MLNSCFVLDIHFSGLVRNDSTNRSMRVATLSIHTSPLLYRYQKHGVKVFLCIGKRNSLKRFPYIISDVVMGCHSRKYTE